MNGHKNAILFIISIILFIYVGILTITPKVLTSTFNKDVFQEKMQKETGLKTKVGKVVFQFKPSLDMVVILTDWSSKYIDDQACFDANYIELTTNFSSLITKNFKIKKLLVGNATFHNQTLPNGVNKLAYLPKSFTGSSFGKKVVTIKSGPVEVRNYLFIDIAPKYYKDEYIDHISYSKEKVKKFLLEQKFTNVKVK